MKHIFPILILICFVCTVANAQAEEEDYRPGVQTIGVSTAYRFYNEKIFNNTQGRGYEFSLFYERGLLDNISLSLGLNATYSDYEEEVFHFEERDQADTAFIYRLFDLEQKFFTVGLPINLRFQYIEYPQIYFLVGLTPEFSFRNQDRLEYINTVYRDKEQQAQTFGQEENPTEPEDVLIKSVMFRLSFGVGVRVSNTNLEFMINNRASGDGPFSLGIRVRQHLMTLNKAQE